MRGMLTNGKPFEIRARWASRVRSAATRSDSMHTWGVELMRAVGCRLSDLPTEDRLWWREVSEGQPWDALRDRAVLEEIITAAEVLAEVLRGDLSKSQIEVTDAA